MALKDILVYADASDAAAARLDVAAGFATVHDAHLVALHVDSLPYTPTDLNGSSIGNAVQQWQRQRRQERAEETEKLVQAAAQRNGVQYEWRRVEGDIESTLLEYARYSDMIVLSQDAAAMDLESPISPSPGAIVLASGRPVMVVPRKTSAKSFGRNILVAWKSTAEAARAVHDAMPILEAADSVTIMEVNPNRAPRSHNTGFELATHLARHGVKVTVTPIMAPDADAGHLLAAEAQKQDMDLVVMGAYGHSRLREMVFGGTTRHVLQDLQIPVFLSH